MTYRVDVYNMPVGTTASHFHVGARRRGRPGRRQLHRSSRHLERLRVHRHRVGHRPDARAAQGINSWEDFVQALLLGNIYMNVHSTANPGGEIRGQVVRVSVTVRRSRVRTAKLSGPDETVRRHACL